MFKTLFLIFQFLHAKEQELTPLCDRCVQAKGHYTPISIWNYFRKRKDDNAYCDLCWNYIHQMKGTCKKCKTEYSIRDKYALKVKACTTCYSIVKMEVTA